jgi:TonB family protein
MPQKKHTARGAATLPGWMIRRFEREKKHNLRLSFSFVSASILLSVVFLLLPRQLPEDKPDFGTIRVTSVSLLDLVPSGDAPGGGGASGVPLPRLPDLPAQFNPVRQPAADTALIFPSEIKEDFGSGGGSGGGSGTGIGTGTGSGSGSGYGIEIQPKLIYMATPEWPEGTKGLVELDVLVNTSGTVDTVRVVRNETLNKKLEIAAIQAAYTSRFLPVRINGKTIAAWARLPIGFEGE